MEKRYEYDMSPFYLVRRNPQNSNSYLQDHFVHRFQELADERFYQVLQGEMDVQEALSQLEQSGQELLDELKLTVE